MSISQGNPMKIFSRRHSEVSLWLFLIGPPVLIIFSTIFMFAGVTGSDLRNSIAAEQWNKLAQTTDFFQEMDMLESLGQDMNERPAALDRLRRMLATYDPFRRPLIAYLMCQWGDSSGVDSVSRAFFAGDYYKGHLPEPDGYAASSNAIDAAYRVLILYGTQDDWKRLTEFLKPADDPLRKGGHLCDILLGLSSIKQGPGLPVGYLKERFPLELAIACLDYTKETGIVMSKMASMPVNRASREPVAQPAMQAK